MQARGGAAARRVRKPRARPHLRGPRQRAPARRPLRQRRPARAALRRRVGGAPVRGLEHRPARRLPDFGSRRPSPRREDLRLGSGLRHPRPGDGQAGAGRCAPDAGRAAGSGQSRRSQRLACARDARIRDRHRRFRGPRRGCGRDPRRMERLPPPADLLGRRLAVRGGSTRRYRGGVRRLAGTPFRDRPRRRSAPARPSGRGRHGGPGRAAMGGASRAYRLRERPLARAHRRVRQPRAALGGKGRARRAATRPALRRAAGFPARPSPGAAFARSRHLPASARAGPGPHHRGRGDPAGGGTAGDLWTGGAA